MKRKIVILTAFVFAIAFAASPVGADTCAGLGTITATGDQGTIQTITYGGITYDTDDLVLGTTKLYDNSDKEVESALPTPGADDFSFNLTCHSTDAGTVYYLQTIFGTSDSWNTFFVFESGGNDNATWYGVKANGDLTTGLYVPSTTAVDTGYNTGYGSKNLEGFVFTTSELCAGLRILPGNSYGVADSGIGFDAMSISTTPIPGAAWLLASGLLGLVVIRRRMRK